MYAREFIAYRIVLTAISNGRSSFSFYRNTYGKENFRGNAKGFPRKCNRFSAENL